MKLCLRMSLHTLHRSKTWLNPTEKCSPALASVRACTHTPLWSIDILKHCTHVAKIQGLLTHCTVRVHVCLLKHDTQKHTHAPHSWGEVFKSSTLYNTRSYLLPWKQPCFALLNIYIYCVYIYPYIYQLIHIIYNYIALYIHSCLVKIPFVLWTRNSNCSSSRLLSKVLSSFLQISPFSHHSQTKTFLLKLLFSLGHTICDLL